MNYSKLKKFSKFAIVASLTILTTTTSAEPMKKYPERIVLESIYNEMHRSGDIDGRLYIANPSEKVLRSTYDLAYESNRLDGTGTMLGPVVGVQKEPLGSELFFPAPPVSKGSISVSCLRAAQSCAEGTIGAPLVCLAALVPGEGLLAAGGCLDEIVRIGDTIQACKDISSTQTCPRSTGYAPQAKQLSIIGSVTNFEISEKFCGGLNRVVAVRGRYKSLYGSATEVLTSLRLVCSNKTTLDFVGDTVDVTPSGSYANSECSQGYLVQGVYGNRGSHIDSIGAICDKVVQTSVSTDVRKTLVGGDGGDPYATSCTEHKYITGAKVFFGRDRKYIQGITLICQ
jgi:Jacalin-like lectin domain